jgi:protein-S-isoprenylcysteine O-methyltransferase Ste14
VEILRLILFLGLVFHKLLWEVMKRRRDLRPQTSDLRPSAWVLGLGSWVKFIKGMILIFLIIQTLFLDLLPISDQPTTLRIIGTIIYFVGLTAAVIGRLQLGKNWVDLEDYQVLPQQSVVTRGIYRYIRHPIYTGDILLLVGLELALNSWLVLGVFIPLLVVIKQALVEEALLAQAFPAYSAYCRQTKRFIPFIL